MANARRLDLLKHLRRAFPYDQDPPSTDGQLLESFLNERNEAAFEVLVRQHAAMVMGVCRRILRHSQDAEDAFQATFLVLVCKAASLRGRRTLANWLYGVARHTALKARAANQRRRWKEQQMRTRHPEPAPPSPEPNDWLPLLDQELSGLPDRYRRAIVLCDLEGKSRREAARLLGWREGTLSGRLARGRVLLARRLSRRGVVLSGATVAAALATEAAASVPHSLILQTLRAAACVAAGSLAAAAVLGGSATSLTEGVLRAMFLTKLKIAAALLLTLSVAGAGVGIFCRGVAAGPPRVDKDEPAGTRAMVVQVQSSPRKDSDVEQTLKRTVNIQFNDTPLGQVLALLADNFRLNMVVDHPALHEAAIAEDHPISMRLDGVALKTALQLMLHDAGLGYRVKDGIIIITTTSQRIVTKVYPVGDLVVFSDKGKHKEDKRTGEEKLIDLITKVVAPQTWSSMGGPATIDFFPLGLSLVINQEPAVHEQIEALLVGLRLFKERAR